MNGKPYSTVSRAMRRMQTGNLLAATAAIRHRLSGATAAGPLISARSPDRGIIEGTFRVVNETPLAKDASAGGSPFPGSITEERTQFSEHKYTGSAGTRRYKLFIPSAYRGQPLPLIVMLHGCTQTPDDFATGTRMNMLADERPCFVVYPAQTQSADVSNCRHWSHASNPRRDQGQPALTQGLARD